MTKDELSDMHRPSGAGHALIIQMGTAPVGRVESYQKLRLIAL